MSLLGKTKIQKTANIFVLLLLIGYAIVKSGIIKPEITTGYEYELPANVLQVASQEDLSEALRSYKLDENGLSKVLGKSGITLEEFNRSVDMELIFNTTQNGFQGLILEFQSTLEHNELKPAYDFIANDLKNAIIKFKNG